MANRAPESKSAASKPLQPRLAVKRCSHRIILSHFGSDSAKGQRLGHGRSRSARTWSRPGFRSSDRYAGQVLVAEHGLASSHHDELVGNISRRRWNIA
jgi:hypothetical protein